MSFVSLLHRTAVAAACAALSLAWAGCTASAPTEPSGTAPFSSTDLRPGTGTAAGVNQFVIVHYTGWLYDATKPDQKGLQFDSSTGREPFRFLLGSGGVILGWDVGLLEMREGGLRRLVIPPSLAYGDRRNGVVPPHATLVFEVELLDVETDES